MAKRELSSTLKNLKFMQRATQIQEKSKNEEDATITPAGEFPSISTVKRCVVIVEGDPHPGVARGRMSFLSFNPSIDKLNDEDSEPSQDKSPITTSGRQSEKTSFRENGSSEDGVELELDDLSSDSKRKLKRKVADVVLEAPDPNNSQKSISRSSQKQHKREKLDWNVLRPPKYPNKKRFYCRQLDMMSSFWSKCKPV